MKPIACLWDIHKFKSLHWVEYGLAPLMYWAVCELGGTASCLARKIGISLSQLAVSLFVQKGERIVKEMGFEL